MTFELDGFFSGRKNIKAEKEEEEKSLSTKKPGDNSMEKQMKEDRELLQWTPEYLEFIDKNFDLVLETVYKEHIAD
jgi:hypothetical protein